MIQIPKTFRGKPVEGAMEKVLAKASIVNPSPVPINPAQNTNITGSGDFWSISGVQYRNGVYEVGLMKELLDAGNTKTQDEWASYSQLAMSRNAFRTPDYPLLYGIVKAIYTARNDSTKSKEVAEAQKFLKNTSRAKWLMTLTRIAYQPNGKDLVTHNYGTNDKYSESVEFVESDGKITAPRDDSVCKTLLGANNVAEVNDVFKWLNGTDTYIWRVNSKPNKADERVAGFGAGSGGASLYCGGDPAGTGSSLGVCLGKKIS